jgi:membrane fusion protein (multidrug efflux system)
MKQVLNLLAATLLIGLIGACSGEQTKESGKGGGRGAPGGDKDRPSVVTAGVIAPHDFIDALEAVGTANARESVSLAADVTDRIKAIRFSDGQYVRKGEILVELAQAEETANLAQSRAQLKEAEAQLARIQSLVKDGYATRSRLDTQTAIRDSARAEVASLEARVQDRFIRAPFSGTIGLRRVSAGQMASASAPLLELTDTSLIKLDFTVPETSLAAVRRGQNIEAIAAAYPDERFSGRIEAIDPQVDPVTRAAALRALIVNTSGRLKPGMLLTVRIERARRTALAVPEQAIIAEGDQKFVFKIDHASKTVEKIAITTGAREPGFVEITGGIPAGARIVVDGTVKIRDGGKVEYTDADTQKITAASAPATRTVVAQ